MEAAIAVPVTLPELRDRFTNAATTPCLAESAALNMDAELGDWNRPEPMLCTSIPKTTITIDDVVVSDDRISNPAAERSKPMMLNGLQPYRSDSHPLTGPHDNSAGGIGKQGESDKRRREAERSLKVEGHQESR